MKFFDLPVVPHTAADLVRMPVYRANRFPADDGPAPWLDRPDAAELIAHHLQEGSITEDEALLCHQWLRDGYVICEGFYDEDLLDRTWAAYEQAIADGSVTPPCEPMFEGDKLPGRVSNPHFLVPAVDRMLFEPRMGRLVSLFLGVKAAPFQTIIGHKSSQQLAHSDSIHMTTYPQGYLAANWIAFEDIHPDSGPLVYYPGSHRLPYVLSDDLGIPVEMGYGGYHRIYEPAIQKLIAEHALQPKIFLPKKGDVLLWHANLLHGGSALNGSAHPSRKALVCHFFAEGCTCYHDLTGTLSHSQVGRDLYTYPTDGSRGPARARVHLAGRTANLLQRAHAVWRKDGTGVLASKTLKYLKKRLG
ncbi:MAG: phytanoyl-CoA dioxygenase family protein [Burkholderiales bacterium]|nr:phytanoyl-CoA dioxygenase family protein [Burkholderiales bacterium]